MYILDKNEDSIQLGKAEQIKLAKDQYGPKEHSQVKLTLKPPSDDIQINGEYV